MALVEHGFQFEFFAPSCLINLSLRLLMCRNLHLNCKKVVLSDINREFYFYIQFKV